MGILAGLSIVFTIVGSGTWARLVMIVAAAALAIANFAAMSKVIYLMMYGEHGVDAQRLLTSGFGIWVFNVITFAVLFKEIGEDSFAFPCPKDEPNRRIGFLDYLFLSFTTATAFSPTDMSPLTTRARMAMMLEATISLATLAVVAARAVNILK